ncbi:polysaccharide biosynthesis/export family protein, partial [Aquidulcibacter paucihalophilus]|uniref:polysaccharide biosynthesis/export family protein n=1 Tax=Aquidulcibacter paucihalophilus TaxID=1978549 RepID=UPI0018E3AB0F
MKRVLGGLLLALCVVMSGLGLNAGFGLAGAQAQSQNQGQAQRQFVPLVRAGESQTGMQQTLGQVSGEEAGGSGTGLDYVLAPNDRVRLIVFGEADLSGEFVIDSAGMASLP